MEPFPYTLHDFTTGDTVSDELRTTLRRELMEQGVTVVRLYSDADAAVFETGLNEVHRALRPDGGTPHGGRGMGGITKIYGAACHPAAATVRTDPRARAVHAALYGLSSEDVMSGWDAIVAVGTDAARKAPPTRRALHHEDPQKAYFAATGGTLQPHVDLGVDTYGTSMTKKMRDVHEVFVSCVQSQFVCKTVPRGGATLVVAPGAYYDKPTDPTLFDTGNGRDFCVCTDKGYAHFRGAWRAVEVPRGCLVLWLSNTPHGNKLADHGVDPERRGVFVSWQARALVSDAERATLKRKKMQAVATGGSTDHWSTHVPKVHKGSHMSNGKKITQVLYTEWSPPVYDADLARRVEEAF
jgi:hypothetical protein